jgi:hypothetical protein
MGVGQGNGERLSEVMRKNGWTQAGGTGIGELKRQVLPEVEGDSAEIAGGWWCDRNCAGDGVWIAGIALGDASEFR